MCSGIIRQFIKIKQYIEGITKEMALELGPDVKFSTSTLSVDLFNLIHELSLCSMCSFDQHHKLGVIMWLFRKKKNDNVASK